MVALSAGLTACGAGASGDPVAASALPVDSSLTPISAAPVVAEASDGGSPIVGAAMPQSDLLFEDPTEMENISSLITLANTGLSVGFAEGVNADSVDLTLIESSWTTMQSCLNLVATAPKVIVSLGPLEPLSNADDVLFHIDGSIMATATRFATGATVQINLHDLDGSLNRVGFNLRSILGRYLWANSGLPEREYPHNCASDY